MVLITGGNSGIGRAAALRRLGCAQNNAAALEGPFALTGLTAAMR